MLDNFWITTNTFGDSLVVGSIVTTGATGTGRTGVLWLLIIDAPTVVDDPGIKVGAIIGWEIKEFLKGVTTSVIKFGTVCVLLIWVWTTYVYWLGPQQASPEVFCEKAGLIPYPPVDRLGVGWYVGPQSQQLSKLL